MEQESKAGVIVRLVRPGCYGFIRRSDNHKDIFFHKDSSVSRYEDMREGMRVVFLESKDGRGRPRAIGVVVD